MEKVQTFLQGKKTYLVAAGLIVAALLQFADTGAIFELVNHLGIALGLGTLRHGIATSAA